MHAAFTSTPIALGMYRVGRLMVVLYDKSVNANGIIDTLYSLLKTQAIFEEFI